MPNFHQQILEKEQEAEEKRLSSALEQQARATLSHLLPDENANILISACGDGALADAMADLWPHHTFTAIDNDKKAIRKARDLYAGDNLTFMTSEVGSSALKPESFDIIIALDFTREKIKPLNKLLTPRGQIYAEYSDIPQSDAMVFVESADATLMDTLKSFADDTEITQGFFLDERPPRIPRTRRFRLPLQWLQAFLAKQENENADITFSSAALSEDLKSHHLRLHYCDEIKSTETPFNIFDDDGVPLTLPPLKQKSVIKKITEDQSFKIYEHRLVSSDKKSVSINAMRCEMSGLVSDLLASPETRADIIPYFIAPNGRLMVFIHDDAPRPSLNLVDRKTVSTSPWSGHMVEAVSIPETALSKTMNDDHKSLVLFTRDYLGLKPAEDAALIDGPTIFPAPHIIDAKVQTKFLKVNTEKNYFDPPETTKAVNGFKNKGYIRHVDAEDLLNFALTGNAPTSMLDVQLIALFKHLEINYRITPQDTDIKDATPDNILNGALENQNTFKPTRGRAGQYEILSSAFIEDGLNHANVQSFALPLKQSAPTSYTLPLIKNADGKIYAGATKEDTPVGTLLTAVKTEKTLSTPHYHDATLAPLSYNSGFVSEMAETYIALDTLKDIVLKEPSDYTLTRLTLLAAESL